MRHQEATVYVHWICLKLPLPLLFWRHQTVCATHTISACFSIAGAEYIRPFAVSNGFNPTVWASCVESVSDRFSWKEHERVWKSIKEPCLLEHAGVDWNCLERLLQPCAIQDICDFIPANLSISDVAGISELQQLACLILKLRIWMNLIQLLGSSKSFKWWHLKPLVSLWLDAGITFEVLYPSVAQWIRIFTYCAWSGAMAAIFEEYVLHFLLEVAAKTADCTILHWIVLLTWFSASWDQAIWELWQNGQWCCQAWFPQQRGWHKSTKPRLEAIPLQRQVQVDFVPWTCKACQMLQAHLKHVVFQAWNTWVPSL